MEEFRLYEYEFNFDDWEEGESSATFEAADGNVCGDFELSKIVDSLVDDGALVIYVYIELGRSTQYIPTFHSRIYIVQDHSGHVHG